MRDALLVLNAGSSSLKFAVFLNDGPPQPLLRGQLEGLLDAATLYRARRDVSRRLEGVAGRHATRITKRRSSSS